MYDLVGQQFSASSLMAAFELSRQQAEILRHLLWFEYADRDSLCNIVGNPSVPIHRLKARLAKYEITITTRRGLGYKLDHEMRSRVVAYLDLKLAQTSYPQELPA